jgi:flagellar assembly factor FliW
VHDFPAIELVQPLPGFPEHRQFALVQLDEDGVLCQLQSLEDPALRFLVMSPVPFFPDYAPEVADDVVEDLRITSPEDVIVLLVLNAGESLDTTTANLMAPVVVNTATLQARQVILDDPSLPLAAPLVA